MDPEIAVATTKQIAFLPWLRLKTTYRIAGVEFVPLRDASNVTSTILVDARDSLNAILSSYIDRKGQSIDNCVVATIPGRGWNLLDSDFPDVEWATALLFLACWASNEYFRAMGPYVNSSSFRLVWQRFSGVPQDIALTSRRRDGSTLDGGYKHGQVKFSAPLQCSLHEPATVDDALLKSLDCGNARQCETTQRLRYALSFVQLANTDDGLMTEPAEAILMGSAFEQLLRGDGSAYNLGRKFDVLFKSCGGVTVEDAKKARSGIKIDESKPERAAVQPQWWVHRKWIEELYNVRNKSAHEGTAIGQNWGWSPAEHLLMAAWVFPLVVKLLLQRDSYYTFSDDDTSRCLAVDKLLAETGWGEEIEGGMGPHKWHKIVSSTANHYRLKQCTKKFLAEHPDFIKNESTESDQRDESACSWAESDVAFDYMAVGPDSCWR